MKIAVCDACYHESKGTRLTRAKYRSSYKSGPNRTSIDTCEDHKEFFKGAKTFDEARAKVDQLIIGGSNC